MEFTPKVSQKLKIEQVGYELTEHPVLPGRGMVYGQEGRQATVYQLAAESGEKYALKVFKLRFRLPSLVGLADKLAPFASLPGLSVCQRTMLIPQRHSDLLQKYPDLLYAALMPWIDGATWHDVIAERSSLTSAQSLAIARSLLDVLVRMEQEGIAHCDLSGPNVIVDGLEEKEEGLDDNKIAVALVDVEQLHAPGLKQPTELAAGSPGYAHHTAENGLWQAEADRFAAAVMLAEMLGWCDERIREAAGEESYFDPSEMQQAGERAALLKAVLQEQWGDPVVRLFERAWQSDTLADCPTMGEWLLALQGIDNQAQQTEDPHTLLIEAGRLEGEGNLVEALAIYERALANCDAGSALHAEIQLIIANLQEKQQQQASTLALEQEGQTLLSGLPMTGNGQRSQKASVALWIVSILAVIFVLAGGGYILSSGILGDSDIPETPIPAARLTTVLDTATSTATTVREVTATPTIEASNTATTTPEPSATATPTNTRTPSVTREPQVRIILSSVNIRNGPGTGYAAFTTLLQDTVVRVIATNADGSWYNVELPNENRGWVAAEVTEPIDEAIFTTLQVAATIPPLPTRTPTPTSTPTPIEAPVPYGGGFTWKDTFFENERTRQMDNEKLSQPLAKIASLLVIIILLILYSPQRAARSRPRRVAWLVARDRR